MKVVLLTLTTLLAYVAAECPNACSGHGTSSGSVTTFSFHFSSLPSSLPIGFFNFFYDLSGTDREGKKNSNGRRREVKKKHEKRTVVIDIDERTMSTAGVGALGRNVCKKGGES